MGFTIDQISGMLNSLPQRVRHRSSMSQPRPATNPPAAIAAELGPGNLIPLVSQMAAGNRQAIGELYDLTSSLIHGVALRMLANPQDAEEVVLDVFMKAWRNAPHYSTERGSVTAWLVMMTRTVAIDRIRSRSAQPHPLNAGQLEMPEPVAATASPEEAVVQNEWRARIHLAMRELPVEQREALMLAFFGGLSHAALAERLHQPLGTIKTRIRLGLRRLRSLLGDNAIIA